MSKNLLNFANFSRTNKDDLCKFEQTTFLTALLTLPIEFVCVYMCGTGKPLCAMMKLQKQFVEFVFRPFVFFWWMLFFLLPSLPNVVVQTKETLYEVKSYLRLCGSIFFFRSEQSSAQNSYLFLFGFLLKSSNLGHMRAVVMQRHMNKCKTANRQYRFLTSPFVVRYIYVLQSRNKKKVLSHMCLCNIFVNDMFVHIRLTYISID